MFEMKQSVQLLLNLFVCILCSCFILYPLLACIVAVVLSLKFWKCHLSRKCASSEDTSHRSICMEQPSINAYERMTYFMKYFRPPQESILNKARRLALKQSFIFNLFSETASLLVMLLPLCMMVLSYNVHDRYAQKLSIEKAFSFRDSLTSSIKTTEEFWHWLKFDFLTTYYGDNSCFDDSTGCGVLASTGCYTVGSPVLRKFQRIPVKCNEVSKYPMLKKCLTDLNGPSSVSENYKSIFVKTTIHQDTPLWGWHGFYQKHDGFISLNNTSHVAYMQIKGLESTLWINKFTQATSIEFLLFNPTSSTFTSVIFLVEFPDFGVVSLFPIMLHFQMHQYSTPWDYLHLVWEVQFLLLFLIQLKRVLWRMIKLRKSYWRYPWNCLQVVFLGLSMVHTVCYIFQFIITKSTIQQLRETRMEVNLNLVPVAYWSMVVQYLSGLLLFIHLISCLKLVEISPILFSILRAVFMPWKQISAVLVFSILFIFNCGFLGNTVIGNDYRKMLIFPPLRCLQSISLILRDYRKPEVIDHNGVMENILTFSFLMAIFWVALGIIAMILSVLIDSWKHSKHHQAEKVELKEVSSFVKQKLSNCFRTAPVTLDTRENIALPIEFLLLELETLTDKLASRANSLFVDCNSMDELSELMENSCNGSNNSLHYEEDIMNSNVNNLCPGKLLHLFPTGNSSLSNNVNRNDSFSESLHSFSSLLSEKKGVTRQCLRVRKQQGAPVTLPRKSSRSRANNCSKVSFFSSSLSSQRQRRGQISSISLTPRQQGRIRKTFPMRHAGSTSSSDCPTLSKEKNFLNIGLSIRKTKSRGKGKNRDLNMDDIILDDSSI